MKKRMGGLFTLLGIVLLIYTIFNLLKTSKKPVSPVPLKEGVKVIYLTPTPKE